MLGNVLIGRNIKVVFLTISKLGEIVQEELWFKREQANWNEIQINEIQRSRIYNRFFGKAPIILATHYQNAQYFDASLTNQLRRNPYLSIQPFTEDKVVVLAKDELERTEEYLTKKELKPIRSFDLDVYSEFEVFDPRVNEDNGSIGKILCEKVFNSYSLPKVDQKVSRHSLRRLFPLTMITFILFLISNLVLNQFREEYGNRNAIFESMNKTLEKRYQKIADFREESNASFRLYPSSYILDQIAFLCPSEIILSELQLGTIEGKVSENQKFVVHDGFIRIQGISTRYSDVNSFMEALDKSEISKSVELKSMVTDARSDGQRFVVLMELNNGE